MERLLEQTRRTMGAGRRSSTRPFRGGQAIEILSSNDVNLGMEAFVDGSIVTAHVHGFETADTALRFEEGVLTIDGEFEVTEEGESA